MRMHSQAIRFTRPAFAAAAILAATAVASPALADDDDGSGPPPVNPCNGYEGLFPKPTLPAGWTPDQGTTPWGICSMFNMSAASSIRVGQSFRPQATSVDWIGFVIQNTNQGGTPGPAQYRVDIASDINSATGVLTGVLGTTEVVSIPLGAQGWFLFRFPASVPVTPGTRYYVALEYVSGYIGGPNSQTGGTGLGVGGRSNNVYSSGNATQYWDGPFGIQNLTSANNDLVFSAGTIAATPPPCVGDLNGDLNRNTTDLTWLLSVYGTITAPGSPSLPADLDANGQVDLADLTLLLAGFGTPC